MYEFGAQSESSLQEIPDTRFKIELWRQCHESFAVHSRTRLLWKDLRKRNRKRKIPAVFGRRSLSDILYDDRRAPADHEQSWECGQGAGHGRLSIRLKRWYQLRQGRAELTRPALGASQRMARRG